ncbi:NB-ARC domain-containing protein [Actinomadura sp. 9N215]|uniref:NB-ARC domain-containing protein n=1 Tax=Actinomadura sp. 9N215 TaxID=3375150 RepID=UPI0037A2D0C7
MVSIVVGIPVNKVTDLVPERLDDDVWLWLGLLVGCCLLVGVGVVWLERHQRRPAELFDVPEQQSWVPREEFDQAVRAVGLSPGATVALTTGLHGAGGFGKTTLARQVCQHPRVRRRFPGGVIWVTVGRDRSSNALAEVIGATVVRLGGTALPTSDLEQAGLYLSQVLAERGPCLLVVDDVWTDTQLRPFLHGAPRCTRLVTTRNPKMLPRSAASVEVDQMERPSALDLLTQGLPAFRPGFERDLLRLTGRWPLLLSLVNGALTDRTARGVELSEATTDVIARLRAVGPAALDVADATSRDRMVRAHRRIQPRPARSVHDRYLELGIFAEDLAVPVGVVAALWSESGGLTEQETADLCALLADRSLLRFHRPAGKPHDVVELHDVLRDYARSELGGRLAAGHRALVEGARCGSWWELPDEPDYLLRQLPAHLAAAGLDVELNRLVTDVRWLNVKTTKFGPVAAEGDLRLARTPLARNMAQAISQIAHLLEPAEPAVITSTLLARLVPETTRVDEWDIPLLTCRWPLPDPPDPRLLRGLGRHGQYVTGVALSPDGTWLATASRGGTVQMWGTDGQYRGTIGWDVGPEVVVGVRIGPGGDWVLTADRFGDVALWDVDGVLLGVLTTGRTGGAQSVAVSPDGAWLATVDPVGGVQRWQSNGTSLGPLLGPTTGVIGAAIAPDGQWLITVDAAGTARRWGCDGRPQEVMRQGIGDGANAGYEACRIHDDTKYRRGRLGQRLTMLNRTQGIGATAWCAALTGWWPKRMAPASFAAGWARADGERRRDEQFLVEGISAVAINADATLVAVRIDLQRITLLNADGTVRAVLDDAHARGSAVMFAPSRTPIPDSGFKNPEDYGQPAPDIEEYQHSEPHLAFVRFPSGQTDEELHVDSGRGVAIYDLLGNKKGYVEELSSTRLGIVAVAPDSDVLALGVQNSALLMRRSTPASGFPTPWTSGVLSARLSPDGSKLYCAYSDDDFTAVIRDLDDPAQESPCAWSLSTAFSSDGFCLMTSHRDRVELWSADGTTIIQDCEAIEATNGTLFAVRNVGNQPSSFSLLNTDGTIQAEIGTRNEDEKLQIAPDGTWLTTTTQSGEVRLWLPTGERRATIQLPQSDEPPDVAIAPDGQWLVARSGDHVAVYDRDGNIRSGHDSDVDNIVIAPGSEWFAASYGHSRTALYDNEGKFRKTLLGTNPVIAPNSAWLATYNQHRATVYLWSNDGVLRHQLEGPHEWATKGIAIAPSSDLLALAGAQGDLTVLDAGSGQFLTGIRLDTYATSLDWFPDGSGLYGNSPRGLYAFTLHQP